MSGRDAIHFAVWLVLFNILGVICPWAFGGNAVSFTDTLILAVMVTVIRAVRETRA